MLSFVVFVWDEDDIIAVDAAVRDGTILVGT
jgi:DNA-directed RNA polymerase beta subunit